MLFRVHLPNNQSHIWQTEVQFTKIRAVILAGGTTTQNIHLFLSEWLSTLSLQFACSYSDSLTMQIILKIHLHPIRTGVRFTFI